MKRALALGLLVSSFEGSASGTSARADVTDVSSLFATCAKIPGLTARFSEEKQIALLAVPLKTVGTVHFVRGRGFVRHATEPSKQSVLVTDKELVLWDGKTTKHVSFGESKAIGTFARTFSLLLAADRQGLEKSFSLELQAKSGAWSLKLVPTDAELKRVIGAIEIEGRELVVSTLRVRETNGDVSTTRFSDVDTAKHYSEEEANRVLRVPP